MASRAAGGGSDFSLPDSGKTGVRADLGSVPGPAPQESSVSERRVAPRQTVTYRMDVSASDGAQGYLLDVSISGMRVFFKQGADVAGTTEIRIDFPRWLELGSGMTARGRFAWVRPSGSSIEGGFAFDGLSRVELALLGRMIERLAEALRADALRAA